MRRLSPQADHSARGLLALLLLIFLLAGCVTHRPQFPIGLYGVPPDAFHEVRAAGFNTITGPPDPSFLDAAREANLRVLVTAGGLAIPTNSLLRQRIQRLDSHPALWAWYLIDEPDLQRIPPSQVAHARRALQKITRKPTLLVLMSGAATAHYGDLTDLLAVDFYPVPWAPISQFSKEIKLAHFWRHPRPYYPILQAFDWSAFPELLDTEVPLRPPTRDELRCMIYLAAAQRASGLFFYTYADGSGRWRLPEHPLWHDLKQLVAEINRHLPIFTAEHLWWSPALEYLEGDHAMHNEVRDARILLRRLRVTHPNPHTPAGQYILAINTTAHPVPFTLQLPTTEPAIPILGQPTPATLDHSVLQKTFAPFEVILYGPFTAGD